MIPVKPQPEPENFDQLVRIPGNKFLKKLRASNSRPTNKQWKYQDHWKHIRHHLWNVYGHVCAYSAHWIAPTANPNVDHYIPKAIKPELAYEWENYRLACPLVNTLKKDYQDILDPFSIASNWFFLDFPSLLLRPNPELPAQKREQIQTTIDRLKLNDHPAFVDERAEWLRQYCIGNTNFSGLKEVAPFIAYELERQNLVGKIKKMMKFELNEEDILVSEKVTSLSET